MMLLMGKSLYTFHCKMKLAVYYAVLLSGIDGIEFGIFLLKLFFLILPWFAI
jgi:hypothetical protein